MKKLFLLIAVAFSGIVAVAQDTEEEYVPGGKDRLVMELNWNGWLDTPDSIDTEWYSRGVNIYLMYDMPLGRSLFSIAPGIGIGVDNVFHDGRFHLDSTNAPTQILPIAEGIEYKKNKLTTTYVDIPIELRFRSKPGGNNMSFKAAVGVKGGYMLSNHTKYIGEGTAFGIYQDEIKVKQHGVPNLSKFRYGVTGRVGYGPFNIAVFYGLSTLFEEGMGPEMAPITIGLSFNTL